MIKCSQINRSKPHLQDTSKKKYLEDVVVLRLLLIFLLIWDHAFAPWSGHWNSLPYQEQIPIYKWLVLLVYNMQFQGLIFLSGYLLGYSSNKSETTLTFKSCVTKKIKRLIVPSIIFSTLYYILFYDTTRSIPSIVYSVVNGCGHMWFLPMLFWCFVGVYLFERIKIRPGIAIIIAVILSIMPCPELPLRIDRTFRFFVYFYMGFGIQRGYFHKLNPKTTIKPILACIGIYLSVFVLNYFCLDKILYHSDNTHLKVLHICGYALSVSSLGGGILRQLLSILMSLSGLLGAFWSANYLVVGKYKLPGWLIKLSTYCYGVYICQQFILIHMYYHTDLPQVVGSVALPWVALLITLILSIFITHILLMTKAGRYLLG